MNVPHHAASIPGWALAFFIGLLGGSGCDSTAPPSTADQDQARKTLDLALSGWQKGETVDGMKKASPSIVVGDPKWSKGAKLTKFEVKGDGKPAGAERVFAVTLWLADSDGKESSESVEYKVGTSPILTVFRAIF
jgi:hypothetical protein